MDTLEELIEECLTTDATTIEPPPPVMWRLHQMSERAYPAIMSMLRDKRVSGTRGARAVRCLAFLSKHDTSKELANLRLAMELAESHDVDVRSAAVHAVAWGVSALKRALTIAADEEAKKNFPTAEQIRAVVVRARAMGLEPEVDRLVGDVLTRPQ